MQNQNWIAELKDGDVFMVVIIQFDLGSHSKTGQMMPTDHDAFVDFKEFGKDLEGSLASYGYARLHWLGDGGLFAKRYESHKDTEDVCDVADKAFELFNKRWNNTKYPISLRACATQIDHVYTSDYPGYWYSPVLNDFLKNERKIAMSGAFVITEKLRRCMSSRSQAFKRFPDETLRRVTTDDGVSFTVYTDSKHRPQVTPAPDRFETWLSQRSWPSTHIEPISPKPQGTPIDGSLIIGSSFGTNGYQYLSLTPVNPDADMISDTEYHDVYKEHVEGLKQLTGYKASITRYIPPLTDDPTLRLYWELIEYPRIRGFHEMVESDEAARGHFATRAFEQDPRQIPSILVTHNVLILKNEKAPPQVVLCHRTKGPRPGGYYNNRWSVSFEEQFSAVESQRGGRRYPADVDLQSTILRGVKEELLGEDFPETILVQLHAVQIELLNLNFGVLGLVVLSGVSFDELVKLWEHPATVDRHEHDAIMAIPCESNTLTRCIESGSLPEDLWQNQSKSSRSNLSADDHLWHPSSKARLAMCLWLVELGVICIS